MNPADLKKTYQDGIDQLKIPAELDDIRAQLMKFTLYDRSDLAGIQLSESDQEILFQTGIPSEYKTEILFEAELPKRSDIPYQIGMTTSCGDPVCLKPDGTLAWLNHDNEMEEVFVNSSMTHYFRCVVALMRGEKSLNSIDPNIATQEPCHWTPILAIQD